MIDKELAERIKRLDIQGERLAEARAGYLLKEAERKHFESTLIRDASGKSHAEKVVNAQATKDWLNFHNELATLEASYEYEKLKYDILDKAWVSEHLSLKIDGNTIQRQR